MKTLTKIALALSFPITFYLGYELKSYEDSIGKHECTYTRSTTRTSAHQNNNIGSTSDTLQRFDNYTVVGRCDFSFEELKEKKDE